MESSGMSRAQALYRQAALLPDAACAAFLDQACGGDAALRAAVEALLGAEPETRAAPAAAPGPGRDEADGGELPAGTRLGAWRLVRLAGRGGMGEVYEAQRADGAFELRAALKLLKRGLDTDALVARFNRERRILARLDHPNIAHVLDAGVAPDGRPFLVMEFVDGASIVDHARSRNLPAAELLRLMITACEAVQAAHAGSIVHRDLKPSNVLVTAQGQVKLLDFGIAKALAEDDDGEATRLGESALTPAYAAPEQLLGLPATPASDVYALGCILYQLLVERLPHRRGGRSAAEIARELGRETIERPSTALRKDRGLLPEPLRLARLKAASRDLDLIALKALHPEARRRYASARELADDLRRLLENRPVLARPDSLAYRVDRFVRRNRLPVGAAAAAILALSAGLGAALWQAHAAFVARNEATQRRQQADDLIDFMLGNLSQRLDAVGRLDVLDSAVAKAVHYIGDGDPRSMDAPTLAQRVRALRHVAGIQFSRGQLKEAAASGGEAVAAARRLQALAPGDAADLLLTQALLAATGPDMDMDDYDAAAALVREGYAASHRLLGKAPRDVERIQAAADFDAALAYLDTYGPQVDGPRAQQIWQECLDLLRPLVESAAGTERQLIARLHCEDDQAMGRLNLSMPAARPTLVELFKQAALDAQAAVQRFPDNMQVLSMAMFLFGSAVDPLVRYGEPDAAAAAVARQIQIAQRLSSLDPDNQSWRRQLGLAYRYDLEVQTVQRHWAQARQDAEAALRINTEVLRRSPGDTPARGEIMMVRAGRAILAVRESGDLGSAVRELDAALALASRSERDNSVLTMWIHMVLLRSLYRYQQDPASVAAELEQAERDMAQIGPLLSPKQALQQRVKLAYLEGRIDDGDRLDRELDLHHFLIGFDPLDYRAAACTPRARRGKAPCAGFSPQPAPQAG
jgi:serine/threonine protein kinase